MYFHLTFCPGPLEPQCLVGQPIGDFLEPWVFSLKQWYSKWNTVQLLSSTFLFDGFCHKQHWGKVDSRGNDFGRIARKYCATQHPNPQKNTHKQTNQPDVCFVHLPSLKLIAPTKNTFSKEKTHHFGALQAFVFQLVLSSTQGSELQKDRINPWSQLDEAQLQLVVLTWMFFYGRVYLPTFVHGRCR